MKILECSCTEALALLKEQPAHTGISCKLCGKHYEKLPIKIERGGSFARFREEAGR